MKCFLEKSPFLFHNSKNVLFHQAFLKFFWDNWRKFEYKISFKIEHLCTEKNKFLAIILTTYSICPDPTHFHGFSYKWPPHTTMILRIFYKMLLRALNLNIWASSKYNFSYDIQDVKQEILRNKFTLKPDLWKDVNFFELNFLRMYVIGSSDSFSSSESTNFCSRFFVHWAIYSNMTFCKLPSKARVNPNTAFPWNKKSGCMSRSFADFPGYGSTKVKARSLELQLNIYQTEL